MIEVSAPAIEIRQSPSTSFLVFAIDGKLLPRFASVPHVGREISGLRGFQRVEILRHVAQIRSYLESPAPLVPNAIVLAFDERIHFEPGASGGWTDTRAGHVHIPLDCLSRPAVIVDGQQRLAAIREADVERFPIAVCAFECSDLARLREQFILVNNTRPLHKSLLYELAGSAEDLVLPSSLARVRSAAALAVALNSTDGALKGRVRTATNPEGDITDTALIHMIRNSQSDGALWRLHARPEMHVAVVSTFWNAVAQVWPQAWAEPPKRSRLTHGAGIVSVGMLCDGIAERLMQREERASVNTAGLARELFKIAPFCAWTAGHWHFGRDGQLEWNAIQNTGRDITRLAQFLWRTYRAVA